MLAAHDPGDWVCGTCRQPSKSAHICENHLEGVFCSGTVDDANSQYLRPPIARGTARFEGQLTLDAESRRVAALGTREIRKTLAKDKRMRLDEAKQCGLKHWACSGRKCVDKINPLSAPKCLGCGLQRMFFSLTFRLCEELHLIHI